MIQTVLLLKGTILSSLRYFKAELVLLMKPVIHSLLEYFGEVKVPIIIVTEELRRLPIPLILAISVIVLMEASIMVVPVSVNSSAELFAHADQLKVETQEGTYEIPEWSESNPSYGHPVSQYTAASEAELPTTDEHKTMNQLVLTDMKALWSSQIATGSHKVTVAILDTGIDKKHEELSGLIVAEADFTGSSDPTDVYGHGTHVAGILAARDNGTGMTGVAPECLLLNVKVADDGGRCQASALAKGVVWAVDNGANVINISIEIKQPSTELEEAVNYAWNHGAVIIAATGNYTGESPIYPAYYENCISVSVIREADNLASLWDCADWVDVAAPGSKIYSTLPSNSYGYKTGTSSAAAYVSGIAALLFNMVTDTNGDGKLNDEVKAVLEAGSQEIGVIKVCKGEQ